MKSHDVSQLVCDCVHLESEIPYRNCTSDSASFFVSPFQANITTRQYGLFKRPVQNDTPAIVRYLKNIGKPCHPFYQVEARGLTLYCKAVMLFEGLRIER